VTIVHTPDGRVFEHVEGVPHTRADVTFTTLAVWVSGCAKCGAAFRVSTPEGATPVTSKAFGRKHCDQHKLTRHEIVQRWQAAIRANAQKGAG
jgi:hypothetical protein